MKRITIVLFAVLALVASGCSVFNGGGKDKTFEGYIKYKMDYEGDVDAQILAQAPTSSTVYYKGAKTLKTQETVGATIKMITDNLTGGMITLMDIPMMGKKIAMKQTKEEVEALKEKTKAEGEEELKATINETGETKEILGYNCKKVDVELGEDIFPVYYTTELNVLSNKNEFPFEDIKGVILEYSMNQQGITTHIVATEIKKQKVNASMFTIPSDYEQMTMEEMMKMFGM